MDFSCGNFADKRVQHQSVCIKFSCLFFCLHACTHVIKRASNKPYKPKASFVLSLSNLAKTGHMRWRCVRIYELPIKRSDLRTAGVILVLLATTPLFFTLAGHHCSRRSFLICQDQAENFHTGWRSGHSALAFVGGLFPHHHWRSNY